jgi:hypothetical protein
MSMSRVALLPFGLSLIGVLSAELVVVGLLRVRRALTA